MPKSKNNIQLVITEDSDEKKVDWNDPESKKEYSKRYFQEHREEFALTCKLQYFKRTYGVEFTREEYNKIGDDLKVIARFSKDADYIKKTYPEYFYKILTKV